MKIYCNVPKFNSKTGKLDGSTREWKETRCDFSGNIVESADDESLNAYHCQYKLDYNDNDPCMGSGGIEYEFGKKYKVDMYRLLF